VFDIDHTILLDRPTVSLEASNSCTQNYSDLRLVSVTPILSRIVERLLVRDYVIPYIPRENLVDQYAMHIKLLWTMKRTGSRRGLN